MHPPFEELFAYRDGELGPEKRAIVEAHVMGCSVCRALIDQVSALEAELRQSPDSAPEGYLDALGESVRSRIAAEASGEAESRPSTRPTPKREPTPAPAVPRETARIEREERREGGRVKEVPRLPWAAVIGTASAAAAVLVVVVILIRQGPYQRMVMPERRTVATSARRVRSRRRSPPVLVSIPPSSRSLTPSTASSWATPTLGDRRSTSRPTAV